MASAREEEEDETEREVRRVLESNGFDVVRIPASATKTADFRVSDEHDKYMIEVKRKEDDLEKVEQFNREFLRDGDATRTEPGGRTDRMQRVVRDAAKQLNKTPSDPEEFKLIWFAACGDNSGLQIDQFRSTIYGEVQMLTARQGGDLRLIPCYYYSFSEFFQLPKIDCAIASSEAQSSLFLNTFSPKAAAFRETKLFGVFERSGSAWDPCAREASGDALIYDLDTKRSDKAAMFLGLRQKYRFGSLELLPFEPLVTIARIGLPNCVVEAVGSTDIDERQK